MSALVNTITRGPPPEAETDLGLDRAKINDEGEVLLSTEKNKRSDSGFSEGDDESASSNLSKRERFSIKAKKLLHISEDPDNEPPGPILADAPDTCSDDRLIAENPNVKRHTAKDFLHHPIETVTSKGSAEGGQQLAANIAAKEISHGREVKLVKAQDSVLNAKTEAEKLLATKEVERLIQERHDMFVRWTIDRHVMKIRKIPGHTVPKMSRKDFERVQPDGKKKMDWEGYANHLAKWYAEEYGAQYIGYTSDPPALPDKNMVMPCVERLLIASGPFQGLAMTIRKVYQWKDPYTTLAYLFGYLTLWTSDMILPGSLIGILYLIMHRRYRGPTIEDLRKDIIRTELMEETALSLPEFIEKWGDQQWQDKIIQELGPWALIQLADLANLMEVLRNFYEWRVPSRTVYTLSYLIIILPILIFVSTATLVRATTLLMGITFFFLFPISSRLPEYRLLASPIRWLFWKIPTHAEWSIKALQAEGASHKPHSAAGGIEPSLTEAQISHGGPDPMGYRGPPTTKDGKPISPTTTHISRDAIRGEYHGLLGDRAGKVVVSGEGLRFLASVGHKELWRCEYGEILKLEKINRVVKKTLGGAGGEDLRLLVENKNMKGVEREVVIKSLEARDQLFSQIIGFSDLRWQVAW